MNQMTLWMTWVAAGGILKADPQKRSIQVYVTTNHWPEGLPHQLDGYEVELVKTSVFRAT